MNSSRFQSNPVRGFLMAISRLETESQETYINCSLGDPTIEHLFEPPQEGFKALRAAVDDKSLLSYSHSFGLIAAREALATHYNPTNDDSIDVNTDVFITAGCSGALDMAVAALSDLADCILVPHPGFPQYETMARSRGLRTVVYQLRPENNWELDFNEISELIKIERESGSSRISMMINNPNNPVGSNWSQDHCRDLMQFCSDENIFLVSDEVYSNTVFKGESFTPMMQLTEAENVNIFTVSSISKQFNCPGWRLGWLLFSRAQNADCISTAEIRHNLTAISQANNGPSSILQSILPALLKVPRSYFEKNNAVLESVSQAALEYIHSNIPEIQCFPARGTIYLLLKLNSSLMAIFQSSTEFSIQLKIATNVLVMPGDCFFADNFIRLIVCIPQSILLDALTRIQRFCHKQTKKLADKQEQEQN